MAQHGAQSVICNKLARSGRNSINQYGWPSLLVLDLHEDNRPITSLELQRDMEEYN